VPAPSARSSPVPRSLTVSAPFTKVPLIVRGSRHGRARANVRGPSGQATDKGSGEAAMEATKRLRREPNGDDRGRIKRTLLRTTGPQRGRRASDEPKRLERATGIEPAFSAWEADVLPLYDARWVRCFRLPMLVPATSARHERSAARNAAISGTQSAKLPTFKGAEYAAETG
jgi:hypothetical protein